MLEPLGWSGRAAEWIALGRPAIPASLRARNGVIFSITRTAKRRASSCARAPRQAARHRGTSGPIFPGGARAVLLTGKALYRALGIPDVRHRRGKDATTHVLMRRVLSLDYLIERPTLGWFADGGRQSTTVRGVSVSDRRTFPYRKYGQPGIPRYFAFKLPIAVDERTGDVRVRGRRPVHR